MPKRKTWVGRKRKAGVDRISELPDSLLVHVLSLLPIHDAIHTEILSKRWKSLWTYLPSFVFRQYTYEDYEEELEYDYYSMPISYDTHREEWIDFENPNFVKFVDKTLHLSNCSKVKKLAFDIEYKRCFASKVDLWTQFAAFKATEELHLEFHVDRYPYHRYKLPQHLFTNSVFRELRFCNCRVKPKGIIDWKSLKKLSIGKVELSNELLQKILSSSPALEMLELYWCGGFSRLDLNNPNLKKLVLRNYREEDKADSEDDNEEADADEHDNEEEEAYGAHNEDDNEEADGNEHDNEEEEEADGADSAEEDEADGNNGFEEDLADGENAVEDDEADGGHGFEDDEADGELYPEGLVISAPHLQSLEISGWSARNWQLINVSSLVEAKLACNFRSRVRGEEEDEHFARIRNAIQNALSGLLSSFVDVKILTVGTRAMKLLSSMEAKGLSSPLLNCTSLTLEACLEDEVNPWIATMLGLSPNLETLVMTKSSDSHEALQDYNLKHYWTSQERSFECLSLHLKKVVFADLSWFHYQSNFFSFVQFLLKNATVLQKVMVKKSMQEDTFPNEFFVAANKLLAFPRSSPDAVVMFC